MFIETKNKRIRLRRENQNRKCEEEKCANGNASGTKIPKLIPEVRPKSYAYMSKITIDDLNTRQTELSAVR